MILKAWRLSKFVLFCALLVAPAALGCVWLLLSPFGGPFTARGGYLWMFSAVAAPWILLGAGLWLVASAAVRYSLHRAAREHRRAQKALGVTLPAPGYIREMALVGMASLALSLVVIAPRYLPAGVLIAESEEVADLPVHGSQRWEGGKYVRDYAPQRILHCTYITFHGLRHYNGPAHRQMPACPYFFEP